MLNKKGIALLAVLVTLLVVVALANVIMNITLSQSRLTLHKVSRIQAYYASTAGVNYALDKLRLGNDAAWQIPTATGNPVWHCMSLSGAVLQCLGDTAPITEGRLPRPIQYVIIRVAFRGEATSNPANGAPWPQCIPPAGVDICVNAQAVYTY